MGSFARAGRSLFQSDISTCVSVFFFFASVNQRSIPVYNVFWQVFIATIVGLKKYVKKKNPKSSVFENMVALFDKDKRREQDNTMPYVLKVSAPTRPTISIVQLLIHMRPKI